jgi:type I restriction enzyme R subunit
MHLLGGKAKAMVVTGSRKEAVRYKLAFDKYIAENKYSDVKALVAFSGDVDDPQSGPKPFNEKNMNPNLKGKRLSKLVIFRSCWLQTNTRPDLISLYFALCM